MTATLWLYVILVAIIALVIGFFAGRFSRKPCATTEQLTQDLEQALQNHERYQQQVQEHFVQSAEVLQHLNQSYQHFCEHMMHSSSGLIKSEELHQQLFQNTPRLEKQAEDEQAPRDYSGESSGLLR
ncbi:YhcB family protein [Dongshaea marina]|uniref:YhcB family protein n=1 Tax=Dongshaea marina TaxID=2047966 RepID=UPI000D3E5ECE|nr:DUF1043 family protein [Dongshaea marina]